MLDNPDTELATGRRVRLNGQDLDVRGTLSANGGDRFLIVSTPDSHACALIGQGSIVEEGEAVDPEEVENARAEEANREEPVTGDTGVTDRGTPPFAR